QVIAEQEMIQRAGGFPGVRVLVLARGTCLVADFLQVAGPPQVLRPGRRAELPRPPADADRLPRRALPRPGLGPGQHPFITARPDLGLLAITEVRAENGCPRRSRREAEQGQSLPSRLPGGGQVGGKVHAGEEGAVEEGDAAQAVELPVRFVSPSPSRLP